MAHITGGGLLDNLPRVLSGVDAVIERGSWDVPPLFQMIVEGAGIDEDEAHRALNMGVGMVLIVDKGNVDEVSAHLDSVGEPAVVIGCLEAGEGVVRWA